jgi:CO/xanthine dehydrogenase Mo-binding subunit
VGYIEPHATLARTDADGQVELWVSSQGHFVVRTFVSRLLGIKTADLRVHAAEIGGAFGGKTVVYVEPVAVMLSRKSGHPVKIMMSREEVFKATGPTSGASMTIKIGVTKDGKIVAADALMKYQAGAFPGSPVMNGLMCGFAPYEIPNVRTIGYDVVCNRPKTVAYRAPGSPISAYAVESTMDAAAAKIGMDPLEFRLKNIAKPGTQLVHGAKIGHAGFAETLQALQKHPAYKTPLGKNQGRGMAVGYWFNGGGESSATVHVNEDGTAVVATGSPDIGGSRASTAQMAAETLGIAYELVRPIIADTNSVGYTQATGGALLVDHARQARPGVVDRAPDAVHARRAERAGGVGLTLGEGLDRRGDQAAAHALVGPGVGLLDEDRRVMATVRREAVAAGLGARLRGDLEAHDVVGDVDDARLGLDLGVAIELLQIHAGLRHWRVLLCR